MERPSLRRQSRSQTPLERLFNLPAELLRQGGPTPSQYPQFQTWLDGAAGLVAEGHVPLQLVTDFWRGLGDDYLRGSLQGHALARPHGYPGDFEMMDKIYDRVISSDARFRAWDLFFQRQAAPRAVRDRAAYFGMVLDEAGARLGRPLRVLDLACGSARHLAPWLLDNPSAPVEIVCIDQDPQALARAEEACSAAEGRVCFEEANALRLEPAGTFDIIWSSGLFDYFSDPTFVRVATRLRGALRSGGEMVLGNFSRDNPSRAYMELVGNWRLRYRSAADLVRIGLSAGAPAEAVSVGKDVTGVNLFLHVRSPAG